MKLNGEFFFFWEKQVQVFISVWRGRGRILWLLMDISKLVALTSCWLAASATWALFPSFSSQVGCPLNGLWGVPMPRPQQLAQSPGIQGQELAAEVGNPWPGTYTHPAPNTLAADGETVCSSSPESRYRPVGSSAPKCTRAARKRFTWKRVSVWAQWDWVLLWEFCLCISTSERIICHISKRKDVSSVKTEYFNTNIKTYEIEIRLKFDFHNSSQD